MIDAQKCIDALQAVYPVKDAVAARKVLANMVRNVRDEEIEQGDFFFQSTYGFHVEKRWFENEPEPTGVEVYIVVARDDDILGEDLL